jgi:hypothetical protein
MMHHLTPVVVFMPFWTGSFLVVGYGEGAPIPWTPQSPELTLDFFLAGFVKDVYHEKVQNVDELHNRIIRAAEYVPSEMLATTW